MPTREGPQVSRGPVLVISATAAALQPPWGWLIRQDPLEGRGPSVRTKLMRGSCQKADFESLLGTFPESSINETDSLEEKWSSVRQVGKLRPMM